MQRHPGRVTPTRGEGPRKRPALPLAPLGRLRGLLETARGAPPPHLSRRGPHLQFLCCIGKTGVHLSLLTSWVRGVSLVSPFLGNPSCVSRPSSSDTHVGVTVPTLGQEPHLFLSVSQCPAHSRCPVLAGMCSFPSLAVSLGGPEAHPHLCPAVGAEPSSWPHLEPGLPEGTCWEAS